MSILSSTKTGKSVFLIPKNRDELIQMIRYEIKEKGYNCDLNHIKTHKITDMSYLFANSKFVGDISKWDVSNVEDISKMFYNSIFNGDISKWNVSNVKDMCAMFYNSIFNGDISKWNVSNVKDMRYMFCRSDFNKDISSWKIKLNCKTTDMFLRCPIKDEYKPLQLIGFKNKIIRKIYIFFNDINKEIKLNSYILKHKT